ncbi:MAG: hypothetical protein GWN62_19085, partial [Aliifodinibius sp.]|nr:hypothetical protein [Fodinibius sp.]
IFYVFSIFSTSFGYLLNDLSDRKLDRGHGKPNTFQNDTLSYAISVVAICFLLSTCLAIPFFNRQFFLILWGIWVISVVAYSLPPFRFKQRGLIGLLIVVFAQRVLPTLIVFSAFNYNNFTDIWLFTLYIFLRGLSSDINHQIEDLGRDAETKINTFAVNVGHKKIKRLFSWVLEAEKILLLILVLRIGTVIHQTYPSAAWFAWLFLGVYYLPLYGISFYKQVRGEARNPFLYGEKNIFQVIHHPFPSIFIPVVFCLFLSQFNSFYVFVLAGFMVNKKLYKREVLLNNFLAISFRRFVQTVKK